MIRSKVNGLIIASQPWANDVTKLGRGKYAEIVAPQASAKLRKAKAQRAAADTADRKTEAKRSATPAKSNIQDGVVEEI